MKSSKFQCIAACILAAVLLSLPAPALAYDPCGSIAPDNEVAQLSEEGAQSTSATGKSVRRISGAVRYDTMASIASVGYSKSNVVILASGENFPDALSASALAGAYNAPILLTASNALSAQTARAIDSLTAKRVIVLGGTSAVSDQVVSALKSKGLSVKRVYGSVRQGTAEAVAKNVAAITSPDTAIIASSAAPWDSLSVSSLAYAKKWPVLLTQADGSLSSSTLATLKSISSIKKVIIVGGNNAVSASVTTQLSAYQVERWWGATRYETSLEIASHVILLGLKPTYVALASGENFPDALAGGALMGGKNGLVLLSASIGTPATFTFLEKYVSDISHCYLFGGTAALDTTVESSCRQALGLSDTADGSSVPEDKMVLLFSPHQDDEVLTMGAFAVQVLGQGCSVHAVLCTDGSASWVKRELSNGLTCSFHTGEHAYELTNNQFVQARDTEFQSSCSALGLSSASIANVLGRAQDSKLTVEKAKLIIRYYLAKYPNAVVCATSPSVGPEQNSDHRALGEAALELYEEGAISDLRLFVEPYYLSQFEQNTPGISLDCTEVENEEERASFTLAEAAYRLWHPDASRYAIGYHSVGSYFDSLDANPASWWYSASRV